ncbi:hypothetical protein BJY24_005473 [Nocardia transvalensis]|uniref:Uncharacterized protein n=1 Tax=Nocardia transvalensis TaxID=37333 RepID=A0A7W9UKK4_9NOCA|nr:hypothetical protein [Nocardia transvalensis]MBB5916561.1 hypothetical protein [Nocardia transvalensis]
MRTTARFGAVAFAVLAVGFYLWHGLTYTGGPYEPGVTAWLNGFLALPIIALTGVAMTFAFSGNGVLSALTGRNSAEFRDGLLGIGTVTSFRQTGLTVNDQPQLRIEFSVEGAEGEVFDSVAKAIIPLTELGLLRPGVVLPVRYLPGRTDKVELDLSGDSAQAQRAMNEAMIRKGFTTAAKIDIAGRGVAAQAVVQSLSVPGEIRDGYARIELGLAVTRPDGSTFTTRAEKFLPPSSVANVQVGRVVQVHYLPDDEQEVVIAIPLNA